MPLTRHHAGTTRTRSELEERFLDICATAGLPQPLINHHVENHECDFVWPAHRLVVETDGFAAHRTRTAFNDDRARDAELLLAGWITVRLTQDQLVADPDRIRATSEP
jgi:hypothetical protein